MNDLTRDAWKLAAPSEVKGWSSRIGGSTSGLEPPASRAAPQTRGRLTPPSSVTRTSLDCVAPLLTSGTKEQCYGQSESKVSSWFLVTRLSQTATA